MKTICRDLAWEQDTLDALVGRLGPEGWAAVTRCGGWSVKDEICHLSYFDHTARLAATDAEAFTRHMVQDLGRIKNMDEVAQITLAKGRAMTTDALMAWWRTERRQLLAALAALNPKDRLPWYGPPMSALSFATARLMETWAHGQDIYDVLGCGRPVSPGLRHIAHLGVTTFGWSFSNRGQEVPAAPVRVWLTAPSGESWTWGDAAADTVTGPAGDFCLVVTQRRHVDDTALVVTGETARRWMLAAQAFAGPPDNGPPPGTFA